MEQFISTNSSLIWKRTPLSRLLKFCCYQNVYDDKLFFIPKRSLQAAPFKGQISSWQKFELNSLHLPLR